jgi:tagatose-1,6-bisphosphate aldolase
MKNLSSITTHKGHFTIAAFDHRNSLNEYLNPQDPSAVNADEIVALKRLFIAAFSDISSAILIDPIYGLDYGLDLTKEVPASTGILMSLEESSYDDSQAGRLTKLLPHWGVDDIKAHSASAKLLLYYHPDAPIAKNQIRLVETLSRECRNKNVIFLIEPIIYGTGKYSSRNKVNSTLKTIDQLSPLVDILKIEFPLNVLQSNPNEWRKVSADISKHATIPWILLSRGMGFDHFQTLTQITNENGASGIAVGRAVWQEIGDLAEKHPDIPEKFEKIKHFLMTTGRDRMLALTQIVEQSAKPWTDFR